VCSVSRAVMNHSSALGSTSWRAIGMLRGPSGPNVVIIAMNLSSSSSTSFLASESWSFTFLLGVGDG
jgi:hypothetical protein